MPGEYYMSEKHNRCEHGLSVDIRSKDVCMICISPDESAMTTTHNPSVNLRFVEREIIEVSGVRRIRVLQQMMIPNDWSTHDEYWQDVPLAIEGEQ